MKRNILLILGTSLYFFTQSISIYAAAYEYDDLGRVTKAVYEDGRRIIQKIKLRNSIRNNIKKGIAMVLLVTMLPFSSFAQIGTVQANAAVLSSNGLEGQEQNAYETENVVPGTEMTEEIHTYGGEDIDAFVNDAVQGQLPEDLEDVVIGEDNVLTGDLTVMNLSLKGGTVDLQGNTLYVCGNFIQSGGVLNVNGGRVVILGDYRIQSIARAVETDENESNTDENEADTDTREDEVEYIPSKGILCLNQEKDYLLVMGDFYTDSEISHSGYLDNGIMEVKGNFTQYATTGAANFCSGGNFQLYLTGIKEQKLEMADRLYTGDCIANLVMENGSEQGVTLVNRPYVAKNITANGGVVNGCIGIGGSTVFTEDYFDGGIFVFTGGKISKELTIGEDLILEKNRGALYLTGQLEVMGNALISHVIAPTGGSLIVDGNMTVSDNEEGYSCGIFMNDASAHILVRGDYIQKTRGQLPMSKGILEVQGNMTVDGTFMPSESQKVVLSGEQAQYVEADNGAAFNILELQNYSEEGVIFGNFVTWKKLIQNGCKVTMGENNGYTGYTLEEDEIISGEFVLTGGTLDLNGHTMTISGDLIQSAGTIILNGGELVVEGDYRRQKRIKDKNGNVDYQTTTAALKMKNANDHLLVKGDFYDSSSAESMDEISAGCLELKGDLYQSDEGSAYSWRYPQGHQLLISGTEKQILHFKNGDGRKPELYDFKITNTSDEGVIIEGTPWIDGKCESSRDSHIEGLVYKASYESEWGGYYGGDLGILDCLNLKNNFELGGNLYLQDRLNVYADLTVDGNIHMFDDTEWKCNGYIYLSEGNLVVKGDVEAQSAYYYSGIQLCTDNAYALIEGDYRILGMKDGFELYSYAGVLEVKGDIDFKGEVVHKGKIILSGTKQQTVRVGKDTEIHELEVINGSEEGVCLDSFVYAKTWNIGENLVTYRGDKCIFGDNLTEDTIIDGNVVLLGGVLALNGHKLQVNGNLTQMAGDVRVNTGRLYIKGDYCLGIPDDELPDYNTRTFGMLYMDYAADYVCVEGNFSANKEKGTWIGLNAGVLEIRGNMDYNHALSGRNEHILLLKGNKKQTVTFNGTDSRSGSGFKNLTLDNQSEEGIVFVNRPYFTGKIVDKEENHVSGVIDIGSMSQLENGYFGGSIYYQNSSLGTDQDIHIGENLLVDCSYPITLNSQLKIDGDLDLNGILKVNHEKLLVGRDLTIKQNNNSYVINGINMVNDDDYVLAGGNFVNRSSRVQTMEAGVLEVKGDYTEYFGIFYGNKHKITFSGSEKQTIQQIGKFHILELKNTSEDGIFSEAALKYDELIGNGCRLIIGDENSVTGFILEDDYIMAGDLYLVDGTMDLAGHTLIVQGDLILQEGIIKVNHGKLIVEGNFRQQKRKTLENGYEYSQSAGYLYMDNTDDYMKIAGDCILMPPFGNGSHMKGTVEIGGDLDSRGSYAFKNDGTLILNGTEKQTILSTYDIKLGNLKVENQSIEGIDIASDLVISGEVSDAEMKTGGEGIVKITDLNCLEEGKFGGNISLGQKCTIEKDIDIKGCLTIQYDKLTDPDEGIRCGEHTVHAGELIVRESLYLEKAQIYVENDLLAEGRGALLMDDSDSYLLVNGNAEFTGDGKSVWTAGTLELKGDLVQTGEKQNFTASDEHRTILSGSRNDKGEDLTQRIHLDAPDNNRFHTLVLKKDLYTCYEFDTVPEDIADEVIYELATTLYPRPVTRITAEQITPFSVTIGFDGKWSEGETAGFAVYRDGVLAGTTGTKSYKDTGLEPGKTYTYTVLPYNGDKNYAKESPEFSVQTDSDGQPPEKVQNLRVSMRTGSAVTLTWDRGKDNVGVTGYRLYRDNELIYEGSDLQYEDKGLENKIVYQYQVEAVDGSGNVSEKCDTVDGVVFVPRILSVEPEDYGVIGGNTAKFQVTFSGEGRSKGNAVKIEYYDNDYYEWKPITKTSIGQKEESGAVLTAGYVWNMENLELGREVDIRYTLRDKDGNETEKIVTYTVDREAPLAPKNVHASDEGGTVIISWEKGGSADCAGYKIYRVQSDAGEGILLADIDGKNSTWYEDVNVEDGKTYEYYVRAYDNFDQLGSMSNVAQVTVQEDTLAPRMVSMTPDPGKVGGIMTLTLEGKDNRQVTEFELYIRKDGVTEWEPLAQIPAETDKGTYLWNTALYEEGTYYIKAAAVDRAGNKSEALFMRRYEVDNTGIAKIILAECNVGSTAIQLTWEDVTEDDFAYFQVEEFRDGKWQSVGQVADTLGIRIENLQPGSSYTYRVLGVDKLGNQGIPSDEITLTTTEDTVLPVISAILPISSYYGEKIPLSMTVEDNGGVAYGIFSYSENGEDYSELARVNAGGGTKEKINYIWDTSALPEGDIYVRFEAYDNAGNHNSLYEEKEIENLYKIDHTAPGKVTGLSVTGEEGVIDLKWGQVSENDIAGFQIYRAKEGTGKFTCIEEKVTSYEYHDRKVQENVTYIYQIAAVDIAGNVGERSEKVYGTVKRDETAPEVTGISPSDAMLGRESVLQVLALDNASLQSIEMDYRRADSDDEWEEIARIPASGRDYYKEIPWNAEGLQEGIQYEVRARAIDKAGNESDYIYRTYTFDLTAPAAPVLESKSGSFRIELLYSANEEEDFECYRIYRKRYGENDYTCIQSGTETEYVDKVEDTESVYYYKVCAYDIYGNYSESNIVTDHANFVDDIAPEAVLPESIGGMTGEEISFDGVLSTDNIRINRYEWDFGDGTTASGARPVHAYAEEGNYTVVLTVSDAQGNKSVTTSTVEVIKADNKGTVQLQVTSGYGIGISGAYVYVKTGEGKNDFKKLRCNSNGYVNIVGTQGTYEVSAFAEGFLPQESVISITPGEKTSRSITLQKGEVVVGKIFMHRMSIDEMIEKGVNLSSPSNYHTYQFSVELRFSESPLPAYIEYQGPLEKEEIIGNISYSNTHIQAALLPPWKHINGSRVIAESQEIPPAVAYIKTTQTVSWLKDMYLVELGINNNAASGFTIHDASATLELPRGLSLATTQSGQTLVNRMGSIGGQLQGKTSWIVKGDESGTYEIGARFHGIMSPFEAQLDSRFVSQMEYEVQTGEGLNIYVYPEEAYYPGEKYYIHFEIKNESARPFYNVKTSIGNFQLPEMVGEVIVKDWKTKEVIEYDRWEGDIHITDPDQKAIPVVSKGARLECGILSPGASIWGTYCVVPQGNEESYYPYVGSLVEELRGANLGVRVTVNPISSHIVKCLQFMDPKTGTIYGDPVDLTTGAFMQDVSSFNVDGASRLSLGIHYNSLAAEYKGQCGYGWTHDYEQHIEDHGSFVDLYLSSYAKVTFISEAADDHVVYGKVEDGRIIIDREAVYEDVFYPTSQALNGWSLSRTEEGYEVISKDREIYRFDQEGRISEITSLDGKGVALAYEGGKTTIRDQVSGEKLYLFYNEEGMISRIGDDHGRTMTLAYDGENLTSHTGADGQITQYVYDGSHRLLYGVDGKGITYVENTYDDKGRIVEQKEAGIGNAAKYSYEDREDGSMTVNVCGYDGQTMSVTVNGKGEKIQEVDARGAVTSYTYDDRGNLLRETDGKGNTESYEYDENNNPVTYTDKNGQTTSLVYDENGNVTSRRNEDGSGISFAYDENGRIIRNISSLGAVTRYAYDDQGNVIRQITDGLGTLSMTYEGGKLTGITDYNGNTTIYGYDAYGNRTSCTDAMGNSTSVTYDEAGKALWETTTDGSLITYEYDAKGQKIKETICGKTGGTRTISYTYDGAGRITAMIGEEGTTAYTYDGEGNIISITYPDGSKDTMAYDQASNLIKATTAAGITTEYSYDLQGNKIQERTGENQTAYEYDPSGRISKIIQADGEEIVYTYDERGNCISETDGKGRGYTYTYDAASNLISETDPCGSRTCYTYDLYGRCIQVTDPKGNSTSYAYDGNGNCIRRTDGAGTVTEFTYDSLNRLITAGVQTKQGNVTTAFAYDEAGRVTAVTDGEGNTTRAAYDSFGNLVSLTDAQGRTVESNTYDNLGRLTETTDALGSVTAYSYDKAGNVTRIVECLNSDVQAETGFLYDADGRLLAVMDAEGGNTSQTYDASGNVASVKDAVGGTTSYSYDSMNRVTEIVNAIGATSTYTYNGEGLLAESRNAKGDRTSYEYDAVGRITRQKDKAGTISYTYDENGNVLTVRDKKGTITRTYDELNRVTSVTDYKGDIVSYAYDQLGNRISITYPGGEIVRYTYDKAGNLKTVTDPWGSVTYYTYDENGRLTETVRGDGSRETREYDGAGHLTELKDVTASEEVINDYSYEYDGRGNIIRITGMDAGVSAYTDGTSGADGAVVNGDGTVTVSIAMTYDEDNRLLTYNGQAVEYDADGNMTRGPLKGGMAEFTYDCRNRLVKVKEEDGSVTAYEYDGENVRTAVITNGVRTEYTTDRESTYSQTLVRTAYEKNVFGFYTEKKEQSIYTYGTGLVSERRDEGNSHTREYYYHYNHLGSTMALSDKDGNVVYRFVYDTYGELKDIQNGDRVSLKTAEEAQEITKDVSVAELANAAGIEYLYNGKYGVSTDRNGLYYMRARYYDQDIKRFINRDVISGDIANSQSLNRYCYVQGNPVSLTDPFGLCPTAEEIAKIEFRRKVHVALDIIGIFFDGADVINALLYMAEGDDIDAALSVLFLLPGVGSLAGLPIKYGMKLGGNIGESVLKLGKKFAPELVENGSRFIRNIGGKIGDAGRWINKKLRKIFPKNIPYDEYNSLCQYSIHNKGAEKVMLGKYDGGGTTSYISRAGSEYEYFDLGENWNVIKKGYGLTDEDLFKLFDEPFLDDAINQEKIFYFSHNPIGDKGALGMEYDYLLKNNYTWDAETMTMKPQY